MKIDSVTILGAIILVPAIGAIAIAFTKGQPVAIMASLTAFVFVAGVLLFPILLRGKCPIFAVGLASLFLMGSGLAISASGCLATVDATSAAIIITLGRAMSNND